MHLPSVPGIGGGNIGIITHESVSFYMFWHSLLRRRNGYKHAEMRVIFMPKREYGSKLCAAGDTDENGQVTRETLS